MSGVTDDPTDPRLTHGGDTSPTPQAEVYLVLSDEERAKGFVRPVRLSYVHVGRPGPTGTMRPLTDQEREQYQADRFGYVAAEMTEVDEHGIWSVSRVWTQEMLAAVDKGCGAVTTMGLSIAETYARDPHFYGATYCVGCSMHRPVGADGEFVWDGTGERVGT